MNAAAAGLITFACVGAGALAGLVLQRALPADHLTDGSRDVVRVVSGLIATLSALVLGLLIASSKGSFDAVSDGIKDAAARMILVDRVLARYGPDARGVRDSLRRVVDERVRVLFPDERAPGASTAALQGSAALEIVQAEVGALVPTDDRQRGLQARALRILDELTQARWLAFERMESSTPTAFLVVLVAWLTAMFASFSLFAPRHGTAVAALAVGVLAVSTAIFLIEEMNQPLDGLIAVSGEPVRSALLLLGR